MEVQAYFDKKKDMYDNLLQYIESEEDSESYFQVLIKEYEDQKIRENKNELLLFLRLLSKVQNNHYRCTDFVNKIQQILLHIKNDITQNFTNSEIYRIFKSDKLIVLFLIKQNIIKVDQSIAKLLIRVSHKKAPFQSYYQNHTGNTIRYLHYFYPEIKPFIDESEQEMYEKKLFEYDPKIFENFEENRQKGQNESHICELIRKDSIDEFIVYFNQNGISENMRLKQSIFETNSFLFSHKETTLCEYAAFFGSIEILKYLHMKDAKIDPPIWLYAVHSQNPIIISFLEINKIEYPNMKDVIYESIKCHHNDIAHYLINLIDNNEENNEYKSDQIYTSFRYFNYEFIPDNFDNIKYILHYACRYSYPLLVNYLVKDDKIDVNEEIEISCYKIETPLNVASKKKNLEIVDILLKHPKIEIGYSALKDLESITEITIPSSSKIIGKSAFEGCTSLVHVVIPSSVTMIDDRAFYNCTSLKEIEIPSSVLSLGSNHEYSTFKNCTSLEKVVIHAQITEFPFYCFDNCKSLKEINIPSSVTVLDKNLFAYCESLETIEIPSSVTSIIDEAFACCKSLKSLNLPPSVTEIRGAAFYGCDSLVDVVINSQTTVHLIHSFISCKSLKSVTFAESAKVTIDNENFRDCTALEHFKIPSSETSISHGLFAECTSLKEVIIPSSVKTIEDLAFYKCTSLTKIVIPSSVEVIKNSAFRNTSLVEISIPSSVKTIEPLAFSYCTNLVKITFESPSSLIRLESSIFDSCTSLVEFTVPSSVIIMKNYIFYRCSSLKKVVFENPSNVEEIGCCIFRDCTSLSELEIPPSVTKIGTLAFMNCSSLSKLIIHPSLSINEKAFEGCTSLTSISLPSSIDTTNLGLDHSVKITTI